MMSEEIGLDGRIIFKWTLKEWDESICTDFFWL
jgi:hypothetical protein